MEMVEELNLPRRDHEIKAWPRRGMEQFYFTKKCLKKVTQTRRREFAKSKQKTINKDEHEEQDEVLDDDFDEGFAETESKHMVPLARKKND